MANMKLSDRVKQAEELARQNHGKLPTNGWLWRNEPKIYSARKRSPEAFAHIECEPEPPKARVASDFVALAEKIAADHNGELPRSSELDAISPSLRIFSQKNPDLFAHIPRARYTKVQAERIAKGLALAWKIAEENGGFLTNDHAFQTKYPTLKTLMYNHPEPFASIPRKVRPTKGLDEHVQTAERLAAENKGLLPTQSFLKKNHLALRSAKQRHPERFAHIPQEQGRSLTPISEYVAQAREIAANHGGIVPTGWWLVSNGFRNVYTAMYRHPEAFKGIHQDYVDRVGAKSIRIY